MKTINKRIKVIPFPEIENAYIVISGKSVDSPNKVTAVMSFLYARGDICVEWETNYGPITVIFKCEKDHPKAQVHWYFEYCTGFGHWGQLAVNENRLGERFAAGDYEGIFNVLKNWRDAEEETKNV